MLRIAKNGPEPKVREANWAAYHQTQGNRGQLKVAAALRAEPAEPWPRKQSKIEVPLCLRPPDPSMGQRARVAPDYHVEVDSPWYSVPFARIKPEVDVRTSGQTVEILPRGRRVASHVRTPRCRRHVTVADHMPSAHRRFAEWRPPLFEIGPECWRRQPEPAPPVTAFCEMVMADRPHPEQGFRTCLGCAGLG